MSINGDVIPIPGTAGPVLVNEGGPEAVIVFGEQRVTPCDTVKQQFDLGAAMVLLDVRPPSQYLTGHIAGAISLPFYDVASYVDVLPMDHWIIAYCNCPHAESAAALSTLEQNGFSMVTLIDEGYGPWRDRGYPVKAGPLP